MFSLFNYNLVERRKLLKKEDFQKYFKRKTDLVTLRRGSLGALTEKGSL